MRNADLSEAERENRSAGLQKIYDELVAHLLALPFVELIGNPGWLSFWYVRPTGDPQTDLEIGREYAEQTLAFARAFDFPPLIGWTLYDVGRFGCAGFVESGFLARIAQSAYAGRLN